LVNWRAEEFMATHTRTVSATADIADFIAFEDLWLEEADRQVQLADSIRGRGKDILKHRLSHYGVALLCAQAAAESYANRYLMQNFPLTFDADKWDDIEKKWARIYQHKLGTTLDFSRKPGSGIASMRRNRNLMAHYEPEHEYIPGTKMSRSVNSGSAKASISAVRELAKLL
jgi:hypothetical protein